MSGKALALAPTLDPISIAEAKAHCRVSIDDDDGLLAGYILAARAHVERETGRVLMTQRWDLNIDRAWPRSWDGACYRSRIVLPLPPLRSVVSIQYVDDQGVTQTLAADQYRVIKGEIFGYVEPAFDVAWPAVRAIGDAITVRFEAGYGSTPSAVPESIRQAMLLLVGHWYENRETVNVGNITGELPFTCEALLASFRTYF
jgi:uncharacterized phiE125 gp8 family phage protein